MCRTAFILLFLGCWLSAITAHAAFVLDDFDDPVEVKSPQMKNTYLETTNVGELAALRNVRIFGSQGNPEGSLDSNISAPSVLTGLITNLNPVPSGSTIASIQTNYTMPPSDFAENGANNAIFLDFLELTSEIAPAFFKILVDDTHNHFQYISQNDLRAPGPFTLMVPFDAFTIRGGAPGLPDFSSIQWISMELRASMLFGGGPDPTNFTMQLDRIRVGRIPEPSYCSLCCLGTLVVMQARVLHYRKPAIYKSCNLTNKSCPSNSLNRTNLITSPVRAPHA